MHHDRTVAIQMGGLRALQATGLHRVLPAMGSGVIFAGHSVRPKAAEAAFDPNHSLSITPQFLDALLGHLKARGIPVVPLSEVMSRLASPAQGFFACFTFDDGYADNFHEALPVFKRHGAPFAVYLASGMLDGTAEPWWSILEAALLGTSSLALLLNGQEHQWALDGDASRRKAFADVASVLLHADASTTSAAVHQLLNQVPQAAAARPAMLTPAMIKAMQASGLVEFGAHTINHVRLGAQPEQVAAKEIAASRTAVEALLGHPVLHFAYPYGNASSYGARERALVARSGFRTAVTTRKALLTRADLRMPFELPRVSLNGYFQDLGLFDVFLSGLPFVGERMRRMTARSTPQEPEAAHAA
jgi:peptidoglycan/xylan/chitin deacetylase (PgdA/CDA1 family)